MAIKAIYTKIDNTYYGVVQSVLNPSTIFNMPGTHSLMETNPGIKQVTSNIWINPICKDTLQTNKEAYDEMIQKLTDEKIKQINNIQNRFVLYMDYSIYNETGEEINHSVVTKELEPVDVMYPLGVGTDCELIYKQIKVFNGELKFSIKNTYPMGIMKETSKSQYNMKINDVSLYQDLSYNSSYVDNHQSFLENTYAYGSHTIMSSLSTMEKIYSTYDDGLIISAVEVQFVPRSITVNIHMAIDNTIVVYDDQKIRDIIIENIGSTYESINTTGYYKAVEKSTVGALLVVNDDYSEDDYDSNTMIHKSDVIKDISDVEVGQYVKYFKVTEIETN